MMDLTVGARDLAKIALRLMGLYYLVQAVRSLPGWLSLLTLEFDATVGGFDYNPVLIQGANLLGIVLSGAFGLFFLLGTGVLLRWFFSDLAEGPVPAAAVRLHTLGFALLGVFIAAWSVVEILHGLTIVLYFLEGSRREFLPSVAQDHWSTWLYGVAGLVVGIVVFQAAARLGESTARR